jgi:hypothetical protein
MKKKIKIKDLKKISDYIGDFLNCLGGNQLETEVNNFIT